ncbi:CAP domain-containing protein [Micromonospora sp. DR5-3]|uniref:CAP domain-containing protein n=1 Tax=unclassified Micromonospora TaxID=2617518 RepID=UPI0011D44B8E|nr:MULTISPECIES: CAP domain-containing protein [unclassified Micromonospora]MCW3813565.1 CAP domain-containing protein [Micromonospora sp. DR5-3]TYC24777.1 serine protease [Micromonospora sp. MP36]
MYRWTDPTEPDGVPRRPEQPADEGPAWLTDRPEPRSAYLFGDDPEQPGADSADTPTGVWPAGAPDAPWPAAPADPRPTSDGTGFRPAEADGPGFRSAADRTGDLPQPGPDWTDQRYLPGPAWTGHSPAADRTGGQPPFEPGAPAAPFERAAGWPPAADPGATWNPSAEPDAGWHATEEPTVSWQPEVSAVGPHPTDGPAWRPVTDSPAEGTGRHRQKRRFPRPLLVGGAAAAATLVVSLGVAAVLLPGGDQRTESTSAEEPVAAAPVVPDSAGDAPGDALAAPTSPTAAPTSARPSPTRTAAPKPSRTTAPSRQLTRSAAPPATAARSAAAPSGISAELQQVVDLVNKERAKAGCKALAVDDKLMLAAQRHSQDQADHKTMSHDGSDGSDPGQRLDRVGYAWRAYGENVAWNQQTPAAVMDAWMNSPGHRANILNCSFTEIGVGVARSNGPYWTQDFGTPR